MLSPQIDFGRGRSDTLLHPDAQAAPQTNREKAQVPLDTQAAPRVIRSLGHYIIDGRKTKNGQTA
jgi:hypothetical protein